MENIEQRMAEIIGEASILWSETPKGIFNTEKAKGLCEEIMTHIKYPINNKNMQITQDEECMSFRKELESLMNKYSYEQYSDTPDFILADYLLKCLDTFNVITKKREKWYGRSLRKRESESNIDELNIFQEYNK